MTLATDLHLVPRLEWVELSFNCVISECVTFLDSWNTGIAYWNETGGPYIQHVQVHRYCFTSVDIIKMYLKDRVCKVVDLLNLSKWQILLNTGFHKQAQNSF